MKNLVSEQSFCLESEEEDEEQGEDNGAGNDCDSSNYTKRLRKSPAKQAQFSQPFLASKLQETEEMASFRENGLQYYTALRFIFVKRKAHLFAKEPSGNGYDHIPGRLSDVDKDEVEDNGSDGEADA